MIKKVYWICCLISVAFSTQLSLSMEVKVDLTDPSYLNIKKELKAAVNINDSYTVKKKLSDFNDYVDTKLSITDLEERLNAGPKIKKYKKDLLKKPTGDSAIDIALKKRYFELLNELLDELGINYIDFLQEPGRFDPDTDTRYNEEIKKPLIEAVSNNNADLTNEILTNFHRYIRKPVEHINIMKNPQAQPFYISTFSNYLGNILVKPMQISAKNQNYTIIYILLDELRTHDFFVKYLGIAQPIINLDNQPVNALLNSILIERIKIYLETRQSKKIIPFLVQLRGIGINQQIMQQILIRVFAIYQLSLDYNENFKKAFIKKLTEENFIDNKFEDDLNKEQLSANLIHYIKDLYFTEATESINNPKTNVNGVDINGDTALILAIDRSISASYQNLADLLIKKADLNQPGKEGKTPLMHAIKIKNIGTILLLLDKGANPNLKDMFGKDALDYAKETKDAKIIKYIEEHMKQPTIMPLNEQLSALTSLNSTLDSLIHKI